MDFLDELLPGYETELAAEQVLWRMLPEQGARHGGTFSDGSTTYWPGSEPSPAWVDARNEQPVDDLWSRTLTLLGYSGFTKTEVYYITQAELGFAGIAGEGRMGHLSAVLYIVQESSRRSQSGKTTIRPRKQLQL